MKYLAMDLGTKTCGLAISDKLGIISSPYKVLRYSDVNTLINNIIKIITEESVDELVLGLPKNMNNSLGFASERSICFKKELEQYTNLPIHLVDERLSTIEAENILIKGDTRRDKRKKIIDAYAASIILDTFLKSKDGN